MLELQTEKAILNDRVAQAMWQAYERSFAHLRTTAVQRHVKSRREFDATLQDKRVLKYFVRDTEVADGLSGSKICALASVTNELEAEPLLSPDYFAHRWPEHFAGKRIWYVGFLAVEPDYQGTGAFTDIIYEIGRTVAESGGLVVLDVCRRVDEVYQLPRIVGRYARSHVPSARTLRLDEQAYYAYEFPAAV